MIKLKEIREAYETIKHLVHKTPLIYSNSLSGMTGAAVYLKAENLQKTGSFKVRGALNRMASITGGEVIAASLGNHAQGVAYAASVLGLKAKIVMPVTAPIVKEEATRSYGADVVLHGENLADALAYALTHREHTFIHPFDDDKVIAGQGTIALEIVEDLKEIDSVIVPVGGGGLIAGIAAAMAELSPATEIVGVQTESAPSGRESLMKEEVVGMAPLLTIADGIAVGRIGEKCFEIMRRYVSDVVLTREDSIAKAILLLLERTKLVVEGAGAVALGALAENTTRFRGKRVILVASGGNIDFTLVDKIIHRGLVSSGRIGLFEVTVEDVPGSLHALTGIISSMRGNILNVVHDRLAGDLPVGKTKVIFTVETRGKGHLDDILRKIEAMGFGVKR